MLPAHWVRLNHRRSIRWRVLEVDEESLGDLDKSRYRAELLPSHRHGKRRPREAGSGRRREGIETAAGRRSASDRHADIRAGVLRRAVGVTHCSDRRGRLPDRRHHGARWVFGALATMFTAVSRRSVEIATLRALGFHAVPVVISVLVEAMVLALAGGILGAAVAYAVLDGYTASTLIDAQPGRRVPVGLCVPGEAGVDAARPRVGHRPWRHRRHGTGDACRAFADHDRSAGGLSVPGADHHDSTTTDIVGVIRGVRGGSRRLRITAWCQWDSMAARTWSGQFRVQFWSGFYETTWAGYGQTASSRRRSLVDEPGDVVRFIRSVSAGFPARSLVLETIGTGAMSRQAGHPLMPHYDPRFKWAVDDVHSLVAGSPYSVASSKFLADLRREERKRLPLMTRLLYLVFSRMSWFGESSRLVRLSSLDR